MSQTAQTAIAAIGINIGKNSFHIVGHDERGVIVLRQKWSRGTISVANSIALATMPVTYHWMKTQWQVQFS